MNLITGSRGQAAGRRLQKIIGIFPFLILFVLTGLLAWELFYSHPNERPSALTGEIVPPFMANNLYPSLPPLSEKIFKGKITLLNVWATWCEACSMEHKMLMKIKNTYHIPIYSLIYKDDPKKARHWLDENGNPYNLIGNDDKGDIAIDLGVYGTPETFVINQEGKIIYRYIGAIDQKSWNDILYPLIKKLGG